MKVIVKNTYDEVCKWAAEHIAQSVNEYKGTNPYVLGLPTGSTPLGVYKELIKLYEAGKVSFKNVITFNMDEYVGLPESHPESYHSFMFNNFFNYIDIKKENVNILNGNAENLEKECEEYEKRIKNAGGIRLFMGGIGEDGHVAFNEPGSALDSRTRQMPLEWETRVVNSRFFDNDPEKVPATALTVGVGTICEADEVLIIANSYKKAKAVKMSIEGEISEQWTCSALQNHKNSVFVLDAEAASQLSK